MKKLAVIVVAVLSLVLGKKGLEDGTTAKRRVAEEQAACAYLGATDMIN